MAFQIIDWWHAFLIKILPATVSYCIILHIDTVQYCYLVFIYLFLFLAYYSSIQENKRGVVWYFFGGGLGIEILLVADCVPSSTTASHFSFDGTNGWSKSKNYKYPKILAAILVNTSNIHISTYLTPLTFAFTWSTDSSFTIACLTHPFLLTTATCLLALLRLTPFTRCLPLHLLPLGSH